MKKNLELNKKVEKQNLSKIAIKNSSYNFASIFIVKLGGLLFTILIARILLPELFGIYALALSIVTIFISLSNFGGPNSFMRYGSESLGKQDKEKFRGYSRFFTRVQLSLNTIIILIVLFSARFISETVYSKPYLYHILIFSCLYILMDSFRNFFLMFFVSLKDFKSITFLDVVYQIFKISFSLLAVVLFADYMKISFLFVALALSAFASILLGFLILLKRDKTLFFGKKYNVDKKRLWKYFWFVSLASISLVFFTSIDTLMLGKFVDAEYLGYYRAALSLVLTISSLFSFSGVLLPIFTQIHKKRFERGFNKTFRALMIFAIPATVGVVFIAKYLIYLIYGSEYLPSTLPLYFLAILIITGPIITLYTTLFQSKEKPQMVAYAVLISLAINIILNYVLITKLLIYGQDYAIIGVAIATVLSRVSLLLFLSLKAKKKLNLRLRSINLRKPILATLIMSLFLLLFNNYIDINLIYGATEIILAAGIYFGVMILIKGVKKEDWMLLRSLIKK